EAEAAVQAMRLLNVRGFNVTMPCKNVVAGLVDELSPAARIIGAVNTVVNDQGRLVGHMTDGGGFVRNLREHGVEVKDKKIVLLGAGGAATAIAVECALQGARAISVFNANDPFLDRARTTAETLAVEVPGCQVKVICLEDQKALRDEIASGDILVNATSVGMKPREDATLIEDVTMLRPGLVVADTVYNPLETKLMRQAREAGCQVIGGKGMLLWQGAIAFKLYTGLDMPVEEYQKEQEKSV
ncbi:MAG: shikimate dehydrogenase, partial [Lachnospiraceae bacterium]|nr:shikimate dehydrogenase [Lachnospiraceae bacterium]